MKIIRQFLQPAIVRSFLGVYMLQYAIWRRVLFYFLFLFSVFNCFFVYVPQSALKRQNRKLLPAVGQTFYAQVRLTSASSVTSLRIYSVFRDVLARLQERTLQVIWCLFRRNYELLSSGANWHCSYWICILLVHCRRQWLQLYRCVELQYGEVVY